VSEYGNIPIKLFVNTKPKIPHTFKNNPPLSSTSFPKFEIKRDDTISSIKSASSSSKIKSSSSSSSAPPHNKKATRNEIKFSSKRILKLICGIITFVDSIP
jgi:hypothetical protein